MINKIIIYLFKNIIIKINYKLKNFQKKKLIQKM